MSISPNSFCQLELHSRDPIQSLAFLRDIMGWIPVPVAFQDSTVIQVPDDCPYGISILKNAQAGPGPVPYFEIKGGLEEILTKSRALGAHLVSGPRLIPGYGQAAVVEEAGGIRLGFFVAQGEAKPKHGS
jgi:predicted enzyme related to lactoylglutathione lyase